MATVRLTYFDGRGLGECVRFIPAACGIEVLTWTADFLASYVCFSLGHGLAKEMITLLPIRIDMFYEGTRDFYKYFLYMVFRDPKEVLAEANAKALPRYLPTFDQALKKNGTCFLVGDSMSLADFGLIESLLSVTQYFGEEALSDYPSLKAFKSMMVSQERIAAFLEGPQRMGGNTELYAATCRKVLDLDF